MKTKKELEAAYRKHPLICPYCQSNKLCSADVSNWAENTINHILCRECGEEWEEELETTIKNVKFR